MTRNEIDDFVSDWIRAWNSRDVEAVLAHFADDVRFTSPVAAEVVGSATIVGKAQLRTYWLAALQRIGRLSFTLDRFIWDPDDRELVIVYWREIDGARLRACELLQFDSSGKVTLGEAMHGAPEA